jgi:hypothetical protein
MQNLGEKAMLIVLECRINTQNSQNWKIITKFVKPDIKVKKAGESVRAQPFMT